MKQRRQKIRKQKQLENLNSTQPQALEYTIDEAKVDYDYLKTSIVTSENIDIIKAKLVLTHEYRMGLLYNKAIDLRENFPYFFVFPDLVRRIFQINETMYIIPTCS